jgi:hypothetical protein
VPDQGSQAFAVQADAERLAIGRLQSAQVQGETAGLAAADLHRGEVAVARDRHPQLVRGRRHTIDLDVGHAACPARRVLSITAASVEGWPSATQILIPRFRRAVRREEGVDTGRLDA